MTSWGRYENLNGQEHFIPQPLALLPLLDATGDLLTLFGETMKSIGKLENAVASMPHSQQVVRAYVIKEALFSSEIEGIAAALADVMEAQSEYGDPQNPKNKNVRDVLNCVESAWTAVRMLDEENFPLGEEVIKTAHQFLLKGTAGESKSPGMYRDGSVVAGRCAPPPAQYVPDLMSDLETFLNTDTYPPLLKAGIAHAQFEAIHPFWDGNGRIGRLLIILTLLNDRVISVPLLYPSRYFKRFRSEYYARLDDIRENGDWQSWMRFYLRALKETTSDAADRVARVINVIESFQERIAGLQVRSGDVVLGKLLESPMFHVNQVARSLSYSFSGANTVIKKLERGKVVKQTHTARQFRRYRLEDYMRVLEDDAPFAAVTLPAAAPPESVRV
jgi:Fic family protein